MKHLRHQNTPKNRYLRVFVSSTFRDMQSERDELVKRTFPQLRRLCELRGVTWSEVDLRWGVTNEEVSEGKVLPICLAEIANCRPFFIGLLGERYGWVPREISEEMITQEPWLADFRGRSVTELEILHGVLNDPEMAGRSFFYFRDPAVLNGFLPEPNSDFHETPTPDEVTSLGPDGARKAALDRIRRLASLKDRIRKSGLPVRENYPDARTLGEMVHEDLKAVIDDLYPEDSVPDPLAREAAEHEAFAASRCEVYVAREEDLVRLDAQAEGNGLPLVVLGNSGSGKSALLANWVRRYRQRRPDSVLFAHFIGATSNSTDWKNMARRVLGEFNRTLSLKLEIPDAPEELRLALARAFHMAAARGPVVVVLDALNQLEDCDQAPDLAWLPSNPPAIVRIIVSTLPGRALDEVTRRRWSKLSVAPLENRQRREIIARYLWEKYRKRLSAVQTERIAAASCSDNPLFLKTLLEELRQFGIHEKLDERIGYYLAAADVADLYRKVLDRLEKDYERDKPNLVRDSMRLLWASRRGLSENELLDLMGAVGAPLPRALWSPLFLAIRESLVCRSGLLGFFHDDLRQAVEQRYLSEDAEKIAAHSWLADYFAAQDLGPRKIDELPWQLAKAEDWPALHAVLTDLVFFEASWSVAYAEILKCWSEIERNSALRVPDGYRAVMDAPMEHLSSIPALCKLLSLMGYVKESARLLDATSRATLASVDRDGKIRIDVASVVSHSHLNVVLAEDLVTLGEWDSAMELLGAAERTFRTLGIDGGLAGALSVKAKILLRQGAVLPALGCCREADALLREQGDSHSRLVNLITIGNVLSALGDSAAVEKTFQETYDLARSVGDPLGLAAVLGNQGIRHLELGDLDRALTLLREQEQICRNVGDKRGLQNCLGHQAQVLVRQGDAVASLSLLREQVDLCRSLSPGTVLHASLLQQAKVLDTLGRAEAAFEVLSEAEEVALANGDRNALQEVLNLRARVATFHGDLEQALRILKRQEQICRDLGDVASLARCLGNLGLVLFEKLDTAGAMAATREAWALASKAGLKELLSNLASTISQIDRAMTASSGSE